MTGINYFEIGGHLIESYIDDHAYTNYGPGAVRPGPMTAHTIAKQLNVPTPVVRAVSKDIHKKTGKDPLKVLESYGRLRRARWAFTTAAALAAADGPLPFGDMAAIGFLGVYGIYETTTAVRDILD